MVCFQLLHEQQPAGLDGRRRLEPGQVHAACQAARIEPELVLAGWQRAIDELGHLPAEHVVYDQSGLCACCQRESEGCLRVERVGVAGEVHGIIPLRSAALDDQDSDRQCRALFAVQPVLAVWRGCDGSGSRPQGAGAVVAVYVAKERVGRGVFSVCDRLSMVKKTLSTGPSVFARTFTRVVGRLLRSMVAPSGMGSNAAIGVSASASMRVRLVTAGPAG